MISDKADTKITVLCTVQKRTSDDVVETLAHLLREATEGRLIGISYAASLPDRRVVMDAVGESCRNPLRALGEVHMLADELTRRLRPYPE